MSASGCLYLFFLLLEGLLSFPSLNIKMWKWVRWLWVSPLPPGLGECCRLQLLELTALNTVVYGIPQHFIEQFAGEITFVV